MSQDAMVAQATRSDTSLNGHDFDKARRRTVTSVFISYARENTDFASLLQVKLTAAGFDA
jgi:hypothetical protein